MTAPEGLERAGSPAVLVGAPPFARNPHNGREKEKDEKEKKGDGEGKEKEKDKEKKWYKRKSIRIDRDRDRHAHTHTHSHAHTDRPSSTVGPPLPLGERSSSAGVDDRDRDNTPWYSNVFKRRASEAGLPSSSSLGTHSYGSTSGGEVPPPSR